MLTYAAFALILLIVAQPFAIIRVIRSGELAINKVFCFSRYSEPRRFWSIIGGVVVWLLLTDLLLIIELYDASHRS